MLSPLFVGSLSFLISTLVAILLVLIILRVVFALAWRLIVIAAIVLGVLWLLSALGITTPGPNPF
jgi:ascorbate-specific PTS system EIIC-type component UlaA